MRSEIKIGGFGGQGVILSGYILGRAASIYDNKYATMIQAFGPEARGGAASAQLIISTDPIEYPYVTNPDIMVLMSQEAYSKFSPEIVHNGLLITEEELVSVKGLRSDIKHFPITATRYAEELGKKMVQNLVMMGFMAAVTGIVSFEAMESAVKASIPKAMIDLNIKAFEKGYEHGKKLVGVAVK